MKTSRVTVAIYIFAILLVVQDLIGYYVPHVRVNAWLLYAAMLYCMIFGAYMMAKDSTRFIRGRSRIAMRVASKLILWMTRESMVRLLHTLMAALHIDVKDYTLETSIKSKEFDIYVQSEMRTRGELKKRMDSIINDKTK